ncbi:hypothetical protein GCM10010279_53750 [Streptomyces mutabilis]|nr:hypothetical protein GCM10010279_53750 [Streptomyces mutabilis]
MVRRRAVARVVGVRPVLAPGAKTGTGRSGMRAGRSVLARAGVVRWWSMRIPMPASSPESRAGGPFAGAT